MPKHSFPSCDIVTPDCVVVHFNLEVSSAAEVLQETAYEHGYNTSLFSLRPSDLEDKEKVRQKIQSTITALEGGEYDYIFNRNNKIFVDPETQEDRPPEQYKSHVINRLKKWLNDEQHLDGLIETWKDIVRDARRTFGTPPAEEAIDKLATYLKDHPDLFLPNIDRIFRRERIPIVLTKVGQAIHTEKEQNYIKIDDHIIGSDTYEAKVDSFALHCLMFQRLVKIPDLGITNEALEQLVPDFGKITYNVDRKREEVRRFNSRQKDASTSIHLGATADRMRARYPDRPELAERPTLRMLGEINAVLTHYPNDPQRSVIQNHFDHAINFHRLAMEFINQRIEERYPERIAAAPPPPPPPTPPDDEESGPKPREPLGPDQVIARADRFAHRQLPEHYKLRSLLQPDPTHPIILKLTDDAGDTSECTITTYEPNADRALDLKRRVQAHLLTIPGIVPYRGPMQEGEYNIGLDELIPSAVPRIRTYPKYGEYRIKFQWPERNEEMSISLGLTYSEANREEAIRRAEFVDERLTQLRTDSADQEYLPITKGDLINTLRAWVYGRGQPWDILTHEPIDQFPMAIKLPFSGRDRDQENWLHIDALQTDGNPNYTWVLPMRIFVNGEQLQNASAHINFHVRDRSVAEKSAVETVNRFLLRMNEYPRHASFAVDPDNRRRLRDLSESARDAAPELIDTNRLKDIHNDLRSPYKQDLQVRLATPPHGNGTQQFSIGVFRGGREGLSEPVLVPVVGNAPPPQLERWFQVSAAHAGEIPRFVEAVDRSFREIVHEEYDPRSNRNYDHERMQKIKAPRPFKPDYAPRLLNDIIDTHLSSFHIEPAEPPARPLAGGAPNGSDNDPMRPHHHEDFASRIGNELESTFTTRTQQRSPWNRSFH